MFTIFARACSFVLVGLALLVATASFVRRSRDVPVTWVVGGRFPAHDVTLWLGMVDPAEFSPCDVPDQRIVAAEQPAPTVVSSPGLAERLSCEWSPPRLGLLWRR